MLSRKKTYCFLNHQGVTPKEQWANLGEKFLNVKKEIEKNEL
jgi:hypothetical protein